MSKIYKPKLTYNRGILVGKSNLGRRILNRKINIARIVMRHPSFPQGSVFFLGVVLTVIFLPLVFWLSVALFFLTIAYGLTLFANKCPGCGSLGLYKTRKYLGRDLAAVKSNLPSHEFEVKTHCRFCGFHQRWNEKT